MFLVIVLIFVIKTSFFQNIVADYVASYFSYELGTEVTVEKVKINGLDYAEVIGLHIKDLKGDTLIYSPKFSGSLAMLSLSSKFAILQAINSENTRVKLQKYKNDTVTNMQFIIDYFATDDTTKSDFKIKINEINLLNVHFSFDNWNMEPIPYGLDYNHIEIKHLYGKVKDLRNRDGVTTFSLEDVALSEKSGFILDKLSCYFLANNNKIKFENLNLLTPFSNLDVKGLSFNYHDYGDLTDFVNAVFMKGDIAPSRLNLKDLSYFVPTFKDFKNNIKIEGKLNGSVNNFNIKELYLGISPVTFYTGEIDIKGLPYIDESLIYLNIDNLQTSANDLEKLNFKALGLEEKIIIPDEIHQLGVIRINGCIDGFINEFYTNLTATTDIGNVFTNIQGGLDKNNLFSYVGDLNTEGLNISQLLQDNSFGTLTSNISLKGSGVSLDELETIVYGNVSKFKLMGYEYENFNFEGSILSKQFDGVFNIKDPNLDLSFNGKIDLNKKVGLYNFETDIRTANLYALHLLNRPTSAFKGNLKVINSSGNNIEDFDGRIVLAGAQYFENEKTYDFDTIIVTSSHDKSYRKIYLRSEFADVKMNGDFRLQNIEESLYALGSRIYPSLFKYDFTEETPKESFDLNVTIRDLSTLTELFYPEIDVAPFTKIGVNYESQNEMFELSASSDWISHGDICIKNLIIDTTRKFTIYDPFYTFIVHADNISISNNIEFNNFKLATELYNDNVHSEISWSDNDSLFWGHFDSDIDVRSASNMVFDLHPSELFYHKIGLWEINRDSYVTMDSTSFTLDNFLAVNEKQTLNFSGVVSENPNDRLKVVIGQFRMDNLNPFMTDTTITFDGVMTATGYITDVYNELYLDAYSWIENFRIGNYYIGNIETIAGWNPIEQRIEITGDIVDKEDKSRLKISKGHYYIKKEENLDFKIEFNKTDVAFANIFMPEGFTDLKGKIKGDVYIKGKTSEPLVTGKLNLDKAGINIDMLNTYYEASGDVLIDYDMILINNLPIKDKFGSTAFLNGSFFHQNYERYSYDFFAYFDKPFLVMNTNYQMNPLYYGDAFATGDLGISYDDVYKMDIKVNAKSEKGTNITLPLYGSAEVELQDFITFINNKVEEEEEYKVNLEGINLNLSMDITEDANIQLVFDDIVGDAMRGKGVGHIDMYIDQFYDFYMFGNYEIYEGSYLFTLKDLINKRFSVKKGGTINWYGDPYEADIDLTAIYNLKTSLFDIMPENQREAYRQKTDVELEMHLKDNLFNPNLNFDINLPRSDENAKTILRNSISSEADMNRQVFSLLLLNKFLPTSFNSASSASGGSALGSSTSEMLSNQLSNMLSKFSDDFDIGFNYQPGDEVSSQEVALALSTQLFDDRVTISTNLGVSHQNAGSNNNSLIGDVDVEVKVNEEGNVRVHAFNQSNEYDITRQEANYTQGVGVFYQESFNNFNELMCKLQNLFIRKDKECKNCNEQCNEMLTEEEIVACKKAKKERIEACRNNKKNK